MAPQQHLDEVVSPVRLEYFTLRADMANALRGALTKVAAFDYVADWLRLEYRNYQALDGMRYLPALLGWYDDGDSPVLVIEDLSDATWPPPWSTEGVDAVLQALADVQATTTPTGIEDAFGALFDIHEGWDPMRADPTVALKL